MKNIPKILVSSYLTNFTSGNGMSGGDRIFIEFFKRIQNEFAIDIIVNQHGKNYLINHGLNKVNYIVWHCPSFKNMYFNLFIMFFYSIYYSLFFNKINYSIVYSVSDFLHDIIPCFFIKLKNKKIKWVSSIFLIASSPFNNFFPYTGYRKIIGSLYFFSQKINFIIIKNFSDKIFFCSEITKKILNFKQKNIVIYGGVDTKTPQNYINNIDLMDKFKNHEFTSCFVGRLHDQKGPVELIKIWSKVVQIDKKSKLAIIGNGPLKPKMQELIKKYNLNNNIILFGFLDGEEKHKIFKKSLIISHPAIYDTGGLACTEGMAWGLPAIAFNLEGFSSCYTMGVIKVDCFNFNQFAQKIIHIKEDFQIYKKMHLEAIMFSKTWEWDIVKNKLINFIKI